MVYSNQYSMGLNTLEDFIVDNLIFHSYSHPTAIVGSPAAGNIGREFTDLPLLVGLLIYQGCLIEDPQDLLGSGPQNSDLIQG